MSAAETYRVAMVVDGVRLYLVADSVRGAKWSPRVEEAREHRYGDALNAADRQARMNHGVTMKIEPVR